MIGRAGLAASAAVALLAAVAGPASAVQESTIQNNAWLLDGTAAERRATLEQVESLGAGRLRVTVIWRQLGRSGRATLVSRVVRVRVTGG